LEADSGKKFKRGIAIYTGENAVAFDKKLFAVPTNRIWKKTSLKTPVTFYGQSPLPLGRLKLEENK